MSETKQFHETPTEQPIFFPIGPEPLPIDPPILHRQPNTPQFISFPPSQSLTSSPASQSDIISPTPSSTIHPTIRHSLCQRHPSNRLADYIFGSSLTTPTPSSSTCRYPISSRNAMKDKLVALDLNQTWSVVDCPPGVKPIRCRWVYRIKRRPNGSVERYKTRLVAKGFTQIIEGVDFLETFSPVVKPTTIRLVLALASMKRWPIYQLDVNNAFLHGDLSEDVYTTLLPGISSSHSNQCCKLLKSLYSLRQSSHMWYEKLSKLLISYGYQQTLSDYSLFVKYIGAEVAVLLVYVDDIVLTSNSISEMATIKSILNQHFKIKYVGTLKYFLGIKVAHSAQRISLSQRKYCVDLLEDSGLLGAKPASVSMDSSTKLHQNNSPLLPDPLIYRLLVGRLLYLTTTRPDITYTTQQLSQFMASPTESHFRAANWVLRYLKFNPSREKKLFIFYYEHPTVSLIGTLISADHPSTRPSVACLSPSRIRWLSHRHWCTTRRRLNPTSSVPDQPGSATIGAVRSKNAKPSSSSFHTSNALLLAAPPTPAFNLPFHSYFGCAQVSCSRRVVDWCCPVVESVSMVTVASV
ncbi:Retrovirus-related Pol polyprotein [Arachis hypogaea]|nr:Retrovirus-related Pol polyprotein [Arachis hypogaea]